MATVVTPQPEQGQMVNVRSRNWMVTEVSVSTLPPDRFSATGYADTRPRVANDNDSDRAMNRRFSSR